MFVLHLISNGGYYLDIGANDPIIASNTWRLRGAGWQGLCFDCKEPASRIPNYHVCDVTKVDIGALIAGVPRIDYISFDVDSSSERALINFPFERYPFSIMTFEHDMYRTGGDARKQACKDRLKHGNYAILFENVMVNGKQFEDWWINMDRFPRDILSFFLKDVSWQEALAKIRAYMPSHPENQPKPASAY